MIDKKFIFINEVGLRDGLQSIPKYVTIDKRLKIVELLIEAGLKHIQVCSFVNPRKIPQMADVERFVNNRDPKIQRFMGELNGKDHPHLGSKLGLDSSWSLNIIKNVGNYKEIYERNVGVNNPL